MTPGVHPDHSTFNNSYSNGSTTPHFGHQLRRSVAAALATYFILLIICGVVFNVVLIHAILLKKRLHATSVSFIEQQHSTTNTFVVNLAVCDLLTAISTIPFDADFLLRGHYHGGLFLCGLKETFFMFSLPASVVNLLLLTGERFVKLIFPFKHGIIYTKLNVAILIIASWTYILAIALLPIMTNRNAVVIEQGKCALHFSTTYTLYQVVGNFSFPTIIILTMNITLYCFVRKRQQSIQEISTSIKRVRSVRCSSAGNTRQSIITLPINFNAAKVIMKLVGVFLICWITFIVTVFVNFSCGICLPREITWIVNAINYSSIALNPVIYGLLNKSIRQMLIKTYLKWYDGRYRNHLGYSMTSLNTSQRNLRTFSCSSISSDKPSSFRKKGGSPLPDRNRLNSIPNLSPDVNDRGRSSTRGSIQFLTVETHLFTSDDSVNTLGRYDTDISTLGL